MLNKYNILILIKLNPKIIISILIILIISIISIIITNLNNKYVYNAHFVDI